jgi:hypothetical protein
MTPLLYPEVHPNCSYCSKEQKETISEYTDDAGITGKLSLIMKEMVKYNG